MPLNDDPNYLAYTIGVKIVTGMQILLSEGSKLKNQDKIEPKQFEKFIQKLSAVDYFEGQIEGSARYNMLLERAKLFFKETLVTPDDEQKNESHRRQVKLLYCFLIAILGNLIFSFLEIQCNI